MTRFHPSGPLRGAVRAAPDKSISHRAAIVGAMAAEPVQVENFLNAADTNATLAAIQALGAIVERRGPHIRIRGCGLRGASSPGRPIDVANAGTLMRLLPGWLAGQRGERFTLDGDESIRRRPVDRIAEPLKLMGAGIQAREDRFPPFTVTGAPLDGITYRLPVASAQVKSCLLLAGLATAGTVVLEPIASRDHTERMLLSAGAAVRRETDGVGWRTTVGGADELEPECIQVPGDLSSAAFLIAAAVLVPGSEISLRQTGINWTRTGFLRILERMGCRFDAELEPPGSFAAHEPIADLQVRHTALTGTTVEPEEVPLAIDELPLVALLGCFAEGETIVRGAAELRVKESDRITTVVEGLRALGADIEAAPDGFRVRGTGGLAGGGLDAGGDHRLALLGAVAGLASRDGVEVAGYGAAGVSYPGFENDVSTLRAA